MEFLALKWAIVEKFHEYLYGSIFNIYTDNNPLTYIVTMAKLDATSYHWVASLAFPMGEMGGRRDHTYQVENLCSPQCGV